MPGTEDLFFGSNRFTFNVTSEVLAGVTRHFNTFADAQTEASLSRVFAGVHFRTDEATGERLGREIPDFVDRFLTPVRRDDDRDADRDEEGKRDR